MFDKTKIMWKEAQRKNEEAKAKAKAIEAKEKQEARDKLHTTGVRNRDSIKENVEKVTQYHENFKLSEYVPVKKITNPEKVYAVSAGVDATPFKKSFKPTEDYYKASYGIQNALSLGLFDANTEKWIINNSTAINKISSYGSLNDLQNDWKNLVKDLGRDKIHSASGVLNMILAFLRALKAYAPLEQLCGKIDMREFETDKSALKIPKGGLSLILGSTIQKTEERFVHAVIKEKTENEDKPPVKIEEEETFVPIREDREPTFVPIREDREPTIVPIREDREPTIVPIKKTVSETKVPVEQSQEETNVPVEQSQEKTNVPVELSQEESQVPERTDNPIDSIIVSENSSSTISPLSTSNTEETTPESFSLTDNYTPITVAPEKNYTPIASEEDSTVLPELEESQESRVFISKSLDSTKIVLMDMVSIGATNIRGEFGEIGKEIVRLKNLEAQGIPQAIKEYDQYKSYSEKIDDIITNISNEFEQLSNDIKESSPENTQICSEIEHLQGLIQIKFEELKNFTVISNGKFEDKINEINEEIETLEALKLGQ